MLLGETCNRIYSKRCLHSFLRSLRWVASVFTPSSMSKISPPQAQTSLFEALANVKWKHRPTIATSFSSSASRTVDHEPVSESIERVFTNASEEWKKQAAPLLHGLCKTRKEFDLDDLDDALACIRHLESDARDRGQLVKNAVKDGWCRRSGVRNSKRKSRHYGYIAVYESLIHSPSFL